MLDLKNISAGYGKFNALTDVSLEVQEEEIVCVVGANGAGKTTLMRAVSGLIVCRQGSKSFLGRDVTRLSAKQLTKHGLVQIPEGRLVIKELSVEDNLRLGAYTHYFKISKSELCSDMDNVHRLFPRLRERKDQLAGTLSGGEQQMLAIGRGLMAKPKLLMLDEPSLGLAPMLVESMFRVIQKLNAEGLPILLVEQNVKAALGIAHRAYILETGSVVTQGGASDLANDPNVISAYLGC